MTLKAIGPTESINSRDWMRVKLGDGEAYLPYGTRVELLRTESGRDHFKVKDFLHWAGKEGSVSRKANGASRLVDPLEYLGPAKISWNGLEGKATVSVPSAPQISSITTDGITITQVPDGTYKIRPKYSDAAIPHVGVAPHATSWWLIEHQPERGFSFHTGARTLGCITVTDRPVWERIYGILVRCRTGDSKYSGEIEIKGHYVPGIYNDTGSRKRWQLDLSEGNQYNGKCAWVERSSSGAFHMESADILTGKKRGYYRIERPNTPEVLSFLGARSEVINQIMARNPPPSYIDFRPVDGKMECLWNGLYWTVDSSGRLDKLEFPGTTSTTTNRPYTCEILTS